MTIRELCGRGARYPAFPILGFCAQYSSHVNSTLSTSSTAACFAWTPAPSPQKLHDCFPHVVHFLSLTLTDGPVTLQCLQIVSPCRQFLFRSLDNARSSLARDLRDFLG